MENFTDDDLIKYSYLFKIEAEIIEIYDELANEAEKHGENSERSIELKTKLITKLDEEEECIKNLNLGYVEAQSFLHYIASIPMKEKLNILKEHLPDNFDVERVKMFLYRISSIFSTIFNYKKDGKINSTFEKSKQIWDFGIKLDKAIDYDIEVAFANIMKEVMTGKTLDYMIDDEIIATLNYLKFKNMAAKKIVEDTELKRSSFGIVFDTFDKLQPLHGISREEMCDVKNRRACKAAVTSIRLLYQGGETSLDNKERHAGVIINRIRLRSNISIMDLDFLRKAYSEIRKMIDVHSEQDNRIALLVVEEFEAMLSQKEFEALEKQ